MFYQNARIFCPDFTFRTGGFEVTDGLFGRILPDSLPADAIDLQGATVIPGLVDIHTHGNSGADFSDGDWAGLKAMAFGIAETVAIRAATYNPACAIGADGDVGSIATGKRADFLVCSPDYRQKRVFLGGKEL